MRLVDMRNNESLEHHLAKRYVFEAISDKKLRISGNNRKGYSIDFDKVEFDFVTAEAIVEYTNKVPYKDNCHTCIGKTESEDDIDFMNTAGKFMLGEVKRNRYENNLRDIESFYQHPCNFCKYKDNLDVMYSFDIGVYLGGKCLYAIEIVKTSGASKSKIEYCLRNDIPLIMIQSRNVLTNHKNRHVEEQDLNKLKANDYNLGVNVIDKRNLRADELFKLEMRGYIFDGVVNFETIMNTYQRIELRTELEYDHVKKDIERMDIRKIQNKITFRQEKVNGTTEQEVKDDLLEKLINIPKTEYIKFLSMLHGKGMLKAIKRWDRFTLNEMSYTVTT